MPEADAKKGDEAQKSRLVIPASNLRALVDYLGRARPVVPATVAEAELLIPLAALLQRSASGAAECIIEEREKK